ncbi:MAG: tetratricopeptide repeat protein [Candidatus Omnitrophica bacterium]|nr:tetratricopeptide repeat protein [Candidatus Omnitrophota bacterium]
MLMSTYKERNPSRIVIAILIFISFVAFQTYSFADTIQKTAQEYRLQGYEAQQKGNISDALTYYSKAVSLGVGLENAVTYNDLGVLYEQIGADVKAEQCYLAAIQLDKNYLPSYTNLAYLYKDNHRFEKAFEFFKKRFEMGSPDDVWTQKAKEELLALRPEYQEVLDGIAAQKLKEAAAKLARELVAKQQFDFNTRIEQANGICRKGQESFDKGDYDKAIEQYQAALKITPDNPKILEAIKDVETKKLKLSINERLDKVKELVEKGDFAKANAQILDVLSIIPKEPASNSK